MFIQPARYQLALHLVRNGPRQSARIQNQARGPLVRCDRSAESFYLHTDRLLEQLRLASVARAGLLGSHHHGAYFFRAREQPGCRFDSHHADFFKKGALRQCGLDLFRLYFLAVTQHDQVFQPSGHKEIPVAVKPPQVPGSEPAFRINKFPCEIVPAVIASHHVRPARLDLALPRFSASPLNSHFNPVQRPAHRGESAGLRRI